MPPTTISLPADQQSSRTRKAAVLSLLASAALGILLGSGLTCDFVESSSTTKIGVVTCRRPTDDTLAQWALIFFGISVAIAGIVWVALLLVWARKKATHRWVSIGSAGSAVCQVPVFLLLESDGCVDDDSSTASCRLSTGSFLLMASIVLWVALTLAIQFWNPSSSNKKDAWKVGRQQQEAQQEHHQPPRDEAATLPPSSPSMMGETPGGSLAAPTEAEDEEAAWTALERKLDFVPCSEDQQDAAVRQGAAILKAELSAAAPAHQDAIFQSPADLEEDDDSIADVPAITMQDKNTATTGPPPAGLPTAYCQDKTTPFGMLQYLSDTACQGSARAHPWMMQCWGQLQEQTTACTEHPAAAAVAPVWIPQEIHCRPNLSPDRSTVGASSLSHADVSTVTYPYDWKRTGTPSTTQQEQERASSNDLPFVLQGEDPEDDYMLPPHQEDFNDNSQPLSDLPNENVQHTRSRSGTDSIGRILEDLAVQEELER